MKYFETLTEAMYLLSKNKKTIFIGQAVNYPGTAMFKTLNKINKKKIIEMPVAEEMQMGITAGLALEKWIPVSIYPRYNFLLLAMNQLVNHLDKVKSISDGQYNSKVIIRTSVGSKYPLNPQHQHVGNYSSSIKKMLTNIEIINLKETNQIIPSYKKALSRKDGRSTILVEYGNFYNSK